MKKRFFVHYARWIDYLFLVLFAIAAYWPVSFMAYSLKGDAINYFLAMRYNTSEALQNHIFPFWSPYINLGYPLHGDMQSGVWNPVVFLISLTGKYDIYRLHAETMLTIIIGGIGIYHLLRYFKLDRKTILAISAAYMLNGYIADAGQFMNWLYAASFLPFVFLFTIRCFTHFNIQDAFFLGLAHSLMFLCAYPADFILLSYIILLFIIYAFLKTKNERSFLTQSKIFLKQIGIASATFIIICLPAILSYWPFLRSIQRGAGIDIDTALMNSLAPANLISFILPWATLKGSAFTETDPLIRNCYIGIIPFIFLLLFLANRTQKTFIQKFLIFLFFIFLILSLGKFGGLRIIAYHLLPLMNTFRHPANSKLFFLFSALIIASFSINQYFNNTATPYKLYKITWGLFLLVSVTLVFSILKSNFIFIIKNNSIDNNLSGSLIKKIRDNLSFFDFLFFNSIFAFLILFSFLLLLYKKISKKWLLPLICIDIFFVLQGMLPLTYVRNGSPKEVAKLLKEQPEKYPLIDPNISLAAYSENGMKYFDKIGCLNPYNKKPGRSDYIITPSNLATQDSFWNNPLFRNKIMQYPFAYLADTILLLKDTSFFVSNVSSKKAVIINKRKPIFAIDTLKLHRSLIKLQNFMPGKMEFEIQNNYTAPFILQQNYYSGWNASINGRKAEILRANITFMSIQIPAGKNIVVFEYKATHIIWAAVFSLLFLLSGLFYFYFKKSIN